MGQVVSLPDLKEKLPALREGRQVVFTNGCFDILHVGHVRYLQEARALGGLLIVGMNSDSSVSRLKGPSRPVQTEKDRAEILAALGCVDFVVLFDDETPLDLIRAVQPDVLVKGGDWPVEKIVGHDVVRARGGLVRSLRFHPGHSTTTLIDKITKL